MSKLIVCTPSPSSGVRHRYILLRQVKGFAEFFGYAVRLLWPVTSGVSFCRHEELFAPVPGVEIENISPEEHAKIVICVKQGKKIQHRGASLPVLRSGDKPVGQFFSWDLEGSGILMKLSGGKMPAIWAEPSARLQTELDAYFKKHALRDRLGIRLRVEEVPTRDRKPHRIQSELDAVLKTLYRIPWYVRVFIVTDSEYVQQTLASHFHDSVFFPKRFGLREPTGRYIYRKDKKEMETFLKEVSCLCACRRVINIGGFLNDGQVHKRLIHEPYDAAAYLHAQRVK
jgi:hypothetical protein